MKKGIDSIDVYFQKIKQIRDKLAVVLVILDDEDCFMLLLMVCHQSMIHLV